MVLKPANLLFLLFMLCKFYTKMDIAVCCDGSKKLEWSILIINYMLIFFFFTAAKAIQLYLIGTTSRFLTFSRRRICSCKNQNKAKNSQTAHAGMATSPSAPAYQTLSQLVGLWDTQWMILLTKSYNEFCFVLMQSPNFSFWIQCQTYLKLI